MSGQPIVEDGSRRLRGDDAWRLLLAGAPVTERRLDLAGVSTAVLEGGDGPPVVLLHGQGGWSGMWLPVAADLVATHRVVASWGPGRSRPRSSPASPCPPRWSGGGTTG